MTKQEVEKGTDNAVFEDFDENTNWESPDDEIYFEVTLTDEQANFLANWDREKSTREEIQDFMAGLQQTVLNMHFDLDNLDEE